MTWLYGVVFLAAVIVDVIPLIAPSAWIVSVLLLVKFHLNPWLVIPLCAAGSTLGRYLMSLYIHRFAGLFIKRRKTEELAFLGKKIVPELVAELDFRLYLRRDAVVHHGAVHSRRRGESEGPPHGAAVLLRQIAE